MNIFQFCPNYFAIYPGITTLIDRSLQKGGQQKGLSVTTYTCCQALSLTWQDLGNLCPFSDIFADFWNDLTVFEGKLLHSSISRYCPVYQRKEKMFNKFSLGRTPTHPPVKTNNNLLQIHQKCKVKRRKNYFQPTPTHPKQYFSFLLLLFESSL